MKPHPRSQEELLRWAAGVIAAAQCDKMHGKVIIHLESGVITRAVTEKVEKPPGAAENSSGKSIT